MPRRRYYRRYYKATPKKKWASNIVQSSVTTSNTADIVVNSAQSSAPTPVIVKCGNFRVQGDVMYTSNGSGSTYRPVNINFFLLFIPEGVTPSDGLIGAHPEWIIGWKALDIGVLSTSQGSYAATSFSFSSRLKRNLNSGDRVIAILQTRDSGMTAQCVFTCQYWTCAN